MRRALKLFIVLILLTGNIFSGCSTEKTQERDTQSDYSEDNTSR